MVVKFILHFRLFLVHEEQSAVRNRFNSGYGLVTFLAALVEFLSSVGYVYDGSLAQLGMPVFRVGFQELILCDTVVAAYAEDGFPAFNLMCGFDCSNIRYYGFSIVPDLLRCILSRILYTGGQRVFIRRSGDGYYLADLEIIYRKAWVGITYLFY